MAFAIVLLPHDASAQTAKATPLKQNTYGPKPTPIVNGVSATSTTSYNFRTPTGYPKVTTTQTHTDPVSKPKPTVQKPTVQQRVTNAGYGIAGVSTAKPSSNPRQRRSCTGTELF